MLVKEYRIPMPMSVDEYRIAQLYMIQKKSREESCGEGSGVEILENKPYEDGPGGTGQYTHKVYHIGKHIPSWFCSILPQAALRVEEESWNAYPYTRTRYTCPFVEKFSIDIETHYKPDTGNTGDVFNLSSAEKRQRTVDPIDIVKDYVPPHEYLVEEDPKLYQSVKTRRGPLSDDWIEEINQSPGQNPVMCAYKLCKVEFRYWGMQSKIERFIHDVGLRKVMVRAHRQAWCWQDEWYGLTIEDIRQLELETQLALARKMAQYSQGEEASGAGGPAAEANGSSNGSSSSHHHRHNHHHHQEGGQEGPEQGGGGEAAAAGVAEGAEGQGGEEGEARGELTKQWSTSSRSSNRSSKRGGSPSHQSISEWRMQSIARDSDDSTDEDEFFDAHDFSDNDETFAKQISKWSSNELMDKMEASEAQETLYQESGGEYTVMSNEDSQMEDGCSQQCRQSSKTHVLILVLHGGNILDSGSGDPSSKQGDVNTLGGAFETVMRVHYPSALGHIAIRVVPCPAVCSEAFSLVSNLSPYSYDEGCLSNSQDHIPLAALPLLATSAPQYQDAVATVIIRANQVYADFMKSVEGASFSGQVCVIGDCVGGILGFDALCSSSLSVCESQNSSRRGSAISVQDTDLLSPGIVINSGSPSLEGSRHLSRSNIDIPRSLGADDPKRQLPRKRSDSSTYELDTIKQHQAFLSSLHSSVLHGEGGSRRSSNSTMLEGGTLGRFDFEVTDFFMFGSPLGLVLALRKTVVPSLDVSALRPACQQVYNLFHPADPSASRLEPLLGKRFHLLPPFSVPRYQRFPLGDGHSALLVETMQCNPHLLVEPCGGGGLRYPEGTVTETSIPVPVLNWQAAQPTVDAPTLGVSRSPSKRLGLLSHLALPYHKLLSRTPSLRSPKGVRPRGGRAECDPVTPDLADVTWPVTQEVLLGSSPPSPRAMRCIEQALIRKVESWAEAISERNHSDWLFGLSQSELTETSARYARKISGTTALQEALTEKQQHIEQLLAERDEERFEVAKATSHAGEVQQELTSLRKGQDQYAMDTEAKLDQLRILVEAADKEKVELLNQLEEEKRKVEDLQFSVEEACITRGDLEAQSKLEHAHIKELEQSLLFEKTKAERLQRDLEDNRVATVSERSRIMELEREVADLQLRLRASKQTEGAAASLTQQQISSLKTHAQTQEKKISELSVDLESRCKELQSLEQDKVSLEDQLNNLKHQLESVEDESKRAGKRVQELDNTIEQASADSQSDKEKGQRREQDFQQQMMQVKEESEKMSQTVEKLEQDKKELESQLEALTQHNSQYQEELSLSREQLCREIEELKLASQNTQPHEDSNSQPSDMKDRESMLNQETSRGSDLMTSDKDRELESLRNEIAVLRAEKAVAKTLRSAVETLERDKAQLMGRVQSLEQRLMGRQNSEGDSVKDIELTGDSSMDQMREEKEFAEGQINFLNSVIVDLQRKNEELKVKLKKMALAEFNGNDDGPDGLDGGLSKRETKPPPRLFCDICDCFDLHDTEDCPTQAQSPDAIPHTAYHGDPAAERPYCDICEVFGHATAACNDDQTF
ncbi:unnamed protein product [Boreogadus saida]